MVIVTVERGSALSDQTCSMNVVEAVKAGDVLVMCIPLCMVYGVWYLSFVLVLVLRLELYWYFRC